MDPDGGYFYLMPSISPWIVALSCAYFWNWVKVFSLSGGTYDNLLMFTSESIWNQSNHFSLAWRQSCSFMSGIKGAKLSPWCAAALYLLSLTSIWHHSRVLSRATVNCVTCKTVTSSSANVGCKSPLPLPSIHIRKMAAQDSSVNESVTVMICL